MGKWHQRRTREVLCERHSSAIIDHTHAYQRGAVTLRIGGGKMGANAT